jgi:hypothetical protein
MRTRYHTGATGQLDTCRRHLRVYSRPFRLVKSRRKQTGSGWTGVSRPYVLDFPPALPPLATRPSLHPSKTSSIVRLNE